MNTLKKILQWILAAAMVLAGINHFLNFALYLRMMPDYFYAPELLIYLSGVFEIALGILLFVPRFTRYAAFGLIALFIAVFPANIYMAHERGFVSRIQSVDASSAPATAICFNSLGILVCPTDKC